MLEMHARFKIWKLNGIYDMESLKKENEMISIDAERTFDEFNILS